jgi:hypothetical protein
MFRLLLALGFLGSVAASSEPVSPASSLPGLREILSAAEWQRAGLDRLSPDELGVIDAALIRHQRSTLATLRAEADHAKAAAAAAAVPLPPGAPGGPAEEKRGWLAAFGLPILSDVDWRSLPPLRAKVVAWENANRFRLDNGQLWEGLEPIPYDLTGKQVEIQARPANRFALTVEGRNTSLRVIRLR